jgi:hypothetical protein
MMQSFEIRPTPSMQTGYSATAFSKQNNDQEWDSLFLQNLRRLWLLGKMPLLTALPFTGKENADRLRKFMGLMDSICAK